MFQQLAMQVLGSANNVNNINVAPGVMMGGMVGATPQTSRARFPYRTTGHLVVLPLAHMVYGIDPVNRRVLWEKDLAVGGGLVAVNPQHPNGPQWNGAPVVDPRDGSVLLAYQDNWAQRLGETGPLEGQAICMQTREALTALDPLTGRVLWSRTDVNPRNYLFADDHHVFVVELDNENKPHATRIFRSADGISVKSPDFSALFPRRLQVFGRLILLTEAGTANGVVLRLYDPLTGEDAWKESYPPRSIVLQSEDASLTGLVEPGGKVHIIDMAQRKVVMTGQMEDPADHLRNVQTIHLLADRKNFYIACEAPPEVNNANRFGGGLGLLSNVMTQLGMRSLPVNGRVYAFKRDDGEVAWHVLARDTFLVLDQFAELPIVLFTARHQELKTGPGGQRMSYPISVLSVEKRSGRVLFAEDNVSGTNSNFPFFYSVRVDARAGTVDFLSPSLKIIHEPKPDDAASVPGDAPPKKAPAPQEAPQTRRPLDGNVRPAAVERVRIREVGNPLPPR
jgi:outer membrane protein assembly factor BamB